MGAGATLHIRVHADTRAAVEAQAERSGHSLSEVAEEWLDVARLGYASTDGLACATGLRRMQAFARAVQDEIGDPTVDRIAHATLHFGMQHLARQIMPAPPLIGRDQLQRRLRYEALVDVLRKMETTTGRTDLTRGLTFERFSGALAASLLRAGLLAVAESSEGELADEARQAAALVEEVRAMSPAQTAQDVAQLGETLALEILGEGTVPEEPTRPPLDEREGE